MLGGVWERAMITQGYVNNMATTILVHDYFLQKIFI